jgi:hypothetical protein
MAEIEVGVLCGVCGSGEIYMQPCPECDHVQASFCFFCGEVYRVVDHHDPKCLVGKSDD